MKILLMIAGVLTLHLITLVCIHRLAVAATKPAAPDVRNPSQGLATKVVFAHLMAVWAAGAAAWQVGLVAIEWSAYLALAGAGLSYCYWGLLVLTESGRRYIILEKVDRMEGVRKADIMKTYNAAHIVEHRLSRLVHWGAIEQRGEHYVSRPCFLATMSGLIRCWARMLNFAWTRRV